MTTISIISGSIREGRASHRIALYFKNYLEENNLAEVKLHDLAQYNFPLFNEQLINQKKPDSEVIKFAKSIESADGVIIISPEYNGGYPAALKNVIDLLTTEWTKKPIGIVPVSSGSFGGMQVLQQLQFSI
jgi:NAD(P)H-dependent FMN reductase